MFENSFPRLSDIQYEQYWTESSIQIERFLRHFLECFRHILLRENGRTFLVWGDPHMPDTPSKNYYGKRFDNRAVRMFG